MNVEAFLSDDKFIMRCSYGDKFVEVSIDDDGLLEVINKNQMDLIMFERSFIVDSGEILYPNFRYDGDNTFLLSYFDNKDPSGGTIPKGNKVFTIDSDFQLVCGEVNYRFSKIYHAKSARNY